MFEQFPYTNFHDLNLDWILKKLKELEEIRPLYAEKIGIVRYYYVDQASGSDENDGLTQATPFQTLGRALELLNQGIVNLGVYFLSGGTYTIPSDRRVFAHCTLHLSVINPVDVKIVSADSRIVGYNVHFSFYGLPTNNLVFEVPTWRMDGGQLWMEYCDIVYGLGLNSCGARLRQCTFRGFSFNNQGGVHLENPTFYTSGNGGSDEPSDSTISMWSVIAGNLYVNGMLTLHNTLTQWYSTGALFAIRGGVLGLSTALEVNTLDAADRVHYLVHTYGAVFCCTDEVVTLLQNNIVRTARINSGKVQ